MGASQCCVEWIYILCVSMCYDIWVYLYIHGELFQIYMCYQRPVWKLYRKSGHCQAYLCSIFHCQVARISLLSWDKCYLI